jgi:hypothetical protein
MKSFRTKIIGENNNMKKLIQSILILITLSLLLMGCGYTAEEKAEMAANEKLGKEIAEKYIKDKYGFTPKIVSTESEKFNSDPIPSISAPPTGYVYLTCEYNGCTFDVVTYAEENTDKIYDNYEYDTIKNNISETIEDILGIIIIDTNLVYGEEFDNGATGLIHDKFTTIQDINVGKFIIQCNTLSSTNGASEETMNTLSGLLPKSSDISILTYNSKEAYDGCPKTTFTNGSSQLDFDIYGYTICISEYLTFSKNKEFEHMSFKVQSIEDNGYTWYFVYSTNIDSISIDKVSSLQASNWNGYGFKNAESISDFYNVTITPNEKTESRSSLGVNVFIPAEQIGNCKVYQIIEQFTNNNGETVKSTVVTQLYENDYISGTIYNKEDHIIALSVEK